MRKVQLFGGVMMIKLLDILENNNWNDLHHHKDVPYTKEQHQVISSLAEQTENYLGDRFYQLATIGEMIAICSDDKEIGGFDKSSMAMMGYFIETEMKTMSKVFELLLDANYQKSKGVIDD